jgi:hypothetical protein
MEALFQHLTQNGALDAVHAEEELALIAAPAQLEVLHVMFPMAQASAEETVILDAISQVV